MQINVFHHILGFRNRRMVVKSVRSFCCHLYTAVIGNTTISRLLRFVTICGLTSVLSARHLHNRHYLLVTCQITYRPCPTANDARSTKITHYDCKTYLLLIDKRYSFINNLY